ncbi:hypothetical protein B0H17DRAFT_1187340 [Mycena rosella]|uniref:Uncharacterized protein n=1 Tax=Mycena rosella TaxID=1033263 RepID=A0AAD7FQT2_MYCRO|nr:hypothetical protein B0H17DRAFT_1187340 [Mycena rosella]
MTTFQLSLYAGNPYGAGVIRLEGGGAAPAPYRTFLSPTLRREPVRLGLEPSGREQALYGSSAEGSRLRTMTVFQISNRANTARERRPAPAHLNMPFHVQQGTRSIRARATVYVRLFFFEVRSRYNAGRRRRGRPCASYVFGDAVYAGNPFDSGSSHDTGKCVFLEVRTRDTTARGRWDRACAPLSDEQRIQGTRSTPARVIGDGSCNSLRYEAAMIRLESGGATPAHLRPGTRSTRARAIQRVIPFLFEVRTRDTAARGRWDRVCAPLADEQRIQGTRSTRARAIKWNAAFLASRRFKLQHPRTCIVDPGNPVDSDSSHPALGDRNFLGGCSLKLNAEIFKLKPGTFWRPVRSTHNKTRERRAAPAHLI